MSNPRHAAEIRPCSRSVQDREEWASPVSHAQPAISTRFRTPSLSWMLARCDLTVLSEMNKSAAISALVRPRAIAWATSVSRSAANQGRLARPGPG